MRETGRYIARVLKDIHDEAAIKDVYSKVHAMASKFPLYPE
jgi:glycine/serine hydroxymethyltransferase